MKSIPVYNKRLERLTFLFDGRRPNAQSAYTYFRSEWFTIAEPDVVENPRRTSKVASRIFLNEIPTFYRLLQYLFDDILNNRMVLQFVCGNHKYCTWTIYSNGKLTHLQSRGEHLPRKFDIRMYL